MKEQKKDRRAYMLMWRAKQQDALREYSKKYRAGHPEMVIESNKKYRANNKDIINEKTRNKRREDGAKHRAYNKKYWLERKELYSARARKWALEHPEQVREFRRRSNEKVGSTITGRLNSSICANIRNSIKSGSKAGRKWEFLVGYTVDQLKQHLEKRFKDGMSWENYGEVWEIDHKIPKVVFNYETPDDIDFKLCWSLKNLQPLDKTLNRKKHDKIDAPFQPSLRLSA
jgi:hypothetical protein